MTTIKEKSRPYNHPFLAEQIDQPGQQITLTVTVSAKPVKIYFPGNPRSDLSVRARIVSTHSNKVIFKGPTCVKSGALKVFVGQKAFQLKDSFQITNPTACDLLPAFEQTPLVFSWKPQDGILKSLKEAYEWHVTNGEL